MSVDKFPVTTAVRALREANVAFESHLYEYEEKGGTAVSSKARGVDEHAVIKTLVMEDDAKRPLDSSRRLRRRLSSVLMARITSAGRTDQPSGDWSSPVRWTS